MLFLKLNIYQHVKESDSDVHFMVNTFVFICVHVTMCLRRSTV